MSVHTVENLFDLPVDYYVRLNFDAFISIVDTLGGVEIDVPFDIVEQDSDRNNNAIRIEKGLQTLNGEEALAYARTRKYDNDIQRGERQQEVLKAIIQKGLSIESVGKYKRLLNDIGRNLTTNMQFDEMTAFHDYVYRGPSHMNIETLTLAGHDETIRGVYYYQIGDEALTATSQKLREHLELE
jgi:anionic cell wall polymer biosynthesis LytR-Cps2A-Psr (LCP) family protein